MNIEIIDTIEAFRAIRTKWENIYHRDPQAQFFISWIWISATIKELSQFKIPWLILAVKSSSNASDYVGFLPLTIETKENEQQGFFYNKLSILGITDADHPGCLCLPEYEAEAVSSLANYLQQQDSWSVWELSNIPQANKRLNLLLSNFDAKSFQITEESPDSYQNSLDNIKNQINPYLTLPDSWELYLQDTLSSNTRQKIRRFLRKIENSAEFRITNVNEENIERHIEVITGFWRASWESRKGVKECNSILRSMTLELRHCFEHNCLQLPVLWQQDKPLGTIANLVDFNKKTILFMVGGRDETFKKFPSGLVLHAYAIRDAIENGFKTYDFLMGNEAYKYSLGAKERYMQTMIVERQNWQEQARKLDVRTLPAALKIFQEFHRVNYLGKAETGYRQILEVQPEHPIALYGLSAIAQRQGKEQDAEALLNHLLQIQPNNIKAWFSLGNLHQTHHRLPQAEQAYQQALSYQPAPKIALAIYHNLGYALQQQDKLNEAIACYQKARELQPDSMEAEVMWANALHIQGKLSPEQQIHYAAINNDLGNKRQQANDLNVAREYYQQAIVLNPNLVEAHYHLGTLLQKKADSWEQAICCYQTVLKLQPNFVLADLGISNVLYAQGKLSPEQQVKSALQNNNVASQYFQASNLKLAIEYYRQGILLNPNLAEAHYGLGLSLHRQGKNNLAESISCYQQALVLKPDFVLAKVALANALHAQGKLSLAQRVESATASYDLGNKYLESGDFKVAVEYYELAILLNPELTEARHNLRLAMEQKEERTIKVSCAK